MPTVRKTKRRPSVSKRLQVIMLACLAVAAVLVVGAGILKQQERIAQGAAEAASFTPAPLATAEDTTRVAFVGDSYTAGDGAENKTETRFSNLVSDHFGWRELNFGVGGTGYITATQGGGTYADRIPEVAATNPDVVFISGGRNDMEPNSEAISSYFMALREALPEAKILALQPMYDSKPYPERLTATSQLIEQAVTAVDGTFIPLPNPLEGKPELINPADDVHPTAEGHQVLANAIIEAVTAAVPELAAE